MYIVDGLSSGLGLGGGGIVDVETTILKAIESAKEAVKGRVLLVLDGLDFLLAATGCGVLEELALLGELREVRFSITVLSMLPKGSRLDDHSS